MRPIDPEDFASGVAWWRTRRWPWDFHNRDYRQMAAENPDGRFDAAWWATVQPRLTAWKALRPVPSHVVAAAVATNAAELARTWASSCRPYQDTDIADPAVTWEAVRAFPDMVSHLKPTKTGSPVFPSKLCHFLLPKIFPVVDQLALGGQHLSYSSYFELVKGTWQATAAGTRQRLTEEIERLIRERPNSALYDGYPIVNKVVELAFIGRQHPRR
ncbi:hypothetical protein [Catellatospora methionotrophica]|uniref:hypothetical protein n=1 Tax=Catellatospora methionotrophica TaxID=121620 RepID=UPI0033E6899E